MNIKLKNFLKPSPSNSKILKNIGLYTILNLLNASVPFLLLPILTKHLSKEDYGIIDIFVNLSLIIGPVVGFSIGSSIIRFYFDRIDFSKFIFNILLFITGSGCVFIGLSFLLTMFFPRLLSYYQLPENLIILAVLYALFSQFGEILLSLWRAEEKPTAFGAYRITKTVLDLGISVFLIVKLDMGWEARIYTAILTTIIFGIFSIYFLVNHYGLYYEVDKTYLKSALSYGIPLILHSFGGYVISFSDRFIILHFLGLEKVGEYAVAYQVGMIMSFITNSFNQAWTPFVFSQIKTGGQATIRKLHKINFIYFIVVIITAIVIYLFIPLIYEVFIGENFQINPQIILWILLGYAVNGMYKMVVIYMFYAKKTKKLSIITVISALINIIITWLMVPTLGILGAAISTFIAFTVMFILVYFDYSKLYKLFLNNDKGYV